MLCRCGHALDHLDEYSGDRKIRTPMVLIKPTGQIAVVCPQCKQEVAIQVGGERRLTIDRMPVLHVPHIKALTTPGRRA